MAELRDLTFFFGNDERIIGIYYIPSQSSAREMTLQKLFLKTWLASSVVVAEAAVME